MSDFGERIQKAVRSRKPSGTIERSSVKRLLHDSPKCGIGLKHPFFSLRHVQRL
jgi:hypothetical protein